MQYPKILPSGKFFEPFEKPKHFSWKQLRLTIGRFNFNIAIYENYSIKLTIIKLTIIR